MTSLSRLLQRGGLWPGFRRSHVVEIGQTLKPLKGAEFWGRKVDGRPTGHHGRGIADHRRILVATVEAVRHLAISADGRVLYAATSGEGVFQLESW